MTVYGKFKYSGSGSRLREGGGWEQTKHSNERKIADTQKCKDMSAQWLNVGPYKNGGIFSSDKMRGESFFY